LPNSDASVFTLTRKRKAHEIRSNRALPRMVIAAVFPAS